MSKSPLQQETDLVMASNDTAGVTVDGVSYPVKSLTDSSRQILALIRFCDEEIHRKQNELAIADTARLAYGAALKRELKKTTSATG